MTIFDTPQKRLEFTEEFRRALYLMEHADGCVFVTGRAGTGKSTLLRQFVASTRRNVAVLAPTGVAALNAGGETIHSFFRFKPDVTPERIKKGKYSKNSVYKKLDTLVIDEVSMVRADLLDCVDRFLRLNGREPDTPFGGVRMLFVGDLYQLPPVVTPAERELFTVRYESPFFFSADAFRDTGMQMVELTKVYRQSDGAFLDILNSIRDNAVTEKELAELNRRCLGPGDGDGAVYLTATNRLAAEINAARLERLDTDERVFEAEIGGDFDQKYYPAEPALRLKTGAQVMLQVNDPFDRWVNGSVGTVADFKFNPYKGEDTVLVELSSGGTVEVAPFKWEVFRFGVDSDTNAVVSQPAGHFVQYPLKLAWAVTIHKSQGKTFDRVVIDAGAGMFAHGQAYVALSRCTTLDGIVLKRPLRREHIIMDRRVTAFLENYRSRPGDPI